MAIRERRGRVGVKRQTSGTFRTKTDMIALIEASGSQDVATVRSMFEEYASTLGFDLDFQSFDDELASLPGRYAPPAGCLLLAKDDGKVAGCVGVRPIDETTCEMKRLYVRPEFRGAGVGRALAEEAIVRARRMGYERMRLDTIGSMTEANALYRRLGFAETEPYRYNPIEGARYFELRLADEEQ